MAKSKFRTFGIVVKTVFLTSLVGGAIAFAALFVHGLSNLDIQPSVAAASTAPTTVATTLPPIIGADAISVGDNLRPLPDMPQDATPEVLPGGDPQLDTHALQWPFNVYAEPDFQATIMGAFAPQTVTAIQYYSHWALISTIYGMGWVCLLQNRLFISRPMGMYNYIGGAIVGRIQPQMVNIADRYNNWLKISTYRGYMWIDLDFTPPIYLLEEFMAQFGNTVSVYYENLATGFIFRHNADAVYFGASATKAPFALYIYLKSEQGYANMNSVHTFTQGDFWEGSGIIRHRYEVGATFTQRRLLELMLAPSDNIATRILRRVHGLAGYREFVASIGANPDHVQSLTYSYLTANDAGIFMRESYRYINSGGRYSYEFRDNLLANRYAFIISDYPVASKSGWAANFGAAWHDMAIVYAPSPYVLVLLSSRDGNAADRRVYDSISMFIQEFNSTWFVY